MKLFFKEKFKEILGFFLLSKEERQKLFVRKQFKKWSSNKSNEDLRLNYNLNENSLVFDVGGYKGDWANGIYSLYKCKIFIFEPVEQFANDISYRFAENGKIIVNKFGLSSETRKADIALKQDSSSIYQDNADKTKITLINAVDFFKEHNIQNIDLMKINIEGGEYDLLEHLIATDFVKNINNIQVQFHIFIPDARKKMKNIQKQLSKTHYLTYQYPFIWENWKLKNK